MSTTFTSRYFPDIVTRAEYRGPRNKDPLHFRYYEPDRVVAGRKMREHMRGAVCAWHTLSGWGADPFGGNTARLPWPQHPINREAAAERLDVLFELMHIVGLDYFTFHDTDLTPEGESFLEYAANMEWLGDELTKRMRDSGRKCLWATHNSFSHPRYMSGAATSSSFQSWAYHGAQVKRTMELAKGLDAAGYVFWGGREGPNEFVTYDLAHALTARAMALQASAHYAKEIGFTGQFYIEPKPNEPTTVQLDADVMGCLGFLKTYHLDDVFKFNVETNHATLIGKPFDYELSAAARHGMLGSIDANEGNTLLGWDTDHFPRDPMIAARAWYQILSAGGFSKGGVNFDAKVRRTSVNPRDRIIAHVQALDVYALGLHVADRVIREGSYPSLLKGLKQGWGPTADGHLSIGENTLTEGLSLKGCEQYLVATHNGVAALLESTRDEEAEMIWRHAMEDTIRAAL